MSTPTDEKPTSPANPAAQQLALERLRAALEAAIAADVQKTHGTLVGALRAFHITNEMVVLWAIVPAPAAMEMARRWPTVTFQVKS